MSTVFVIDPSTSVRETLRIVLAAEHDVAAVATLTERPPDPVPDVVVLGLPPPPRDERAVGKALARAFPGVPVLLLHAVRDVDPGVVVPPRVAFECLPKPFDAYAVRARVRDLLTARSRTAREDELHVADRHWLESPRLAPAAAAIAGRVLASRPAVVLVQGEHGTGVASVARALHVVGAWPGSFVAVDVARLEPGELARILGARRTGTIHLAHLDHASWRLQAEVGELVDAIHAGTRDVRIVAGAERDLCVLAAEGTFLPELAYAVSAVPIVLVPLRERPDDVPALVEASTRALAPRLGLGAVVYRPAALDRLRQYLWFGNLAELEAVVTRTLVLHRPPIVEPEHLVFLPDQTARALAPPSSGRAEAPSSEAAGASVEGLAGPDLEVLLGELAHELRNPMVTIKTVAQHFDGILADPEARERFARLMVDAVERMDGVVETLLEFSRFHTPTPQPTDVGALLDRALDEHGEDLARRNVRLERNGAAPRSVVIDEAQVLFALRCLCRGLLPSVVPHSTLAVRRVEDGALELHVRAEPSVAARLSAWVEPHRNGAEEAPPLVWVLAAALLARNGGTLAVRKGDDRATVLRVAWTPAANRGTAAE